MPLRILCEGNGCNTVSTRRFERSESGSVLESRYLCDACPPPPEWDEADHHYMPRQYEKPWPLQPIYVDDNGQSRFRENKIIRRLLDDGPYDLNKIIMWVYRGEIDPEDYEHFLQLIGYSVYGFGEIGLVSEQTYKRACRVMAAQRRPKGMT